MLLEHCINNDISQSYTKHRKACNSTGILKIAEHSITIDSQTEEVTKRANVTVADSQARAPRASHNGSLKTKIRIMFKRVEWTENSHVRLLFQDIPDLAGDKSAR